MLSIFLFLISLSNVDNNHFQRKKSAKSNIFLLFIHEILLLILDCNNHRCKEENSKMSEFRTFFLLLYKINKNLVSSSILSFSILIKFISKHFSFFWIRNLIKTKSKRWQSDGWKKRRKKARTKFCYCLLPFILQLNNKENDAYKVCEEENILFF